MKNEFFCTFHSIIRCIKNYKNFNIDQFPTTLINDFKVLIKSFLVTTFLVLKKLCQKKLVSKITELSLSRNSPQLPYILTLINCLVQNRTPDNPNRLSAQESTFLDDYTECVGDLFSSLCLDHLPGTSDWANKKVPTSSLYSCALCG